MLTLVLLTVASVFFIIPVAYMAAWGRGKLGPRNKALAALITAAAMAYCWYVAWSLAKFAF